MNSDKSKTKKELLLELESLREKIKSGESEADTGIKHRDRLDSEELSILLNAAMELGSTLDLNSVMQAATDHITKLTNIGTSAIYLVKEADLYVGATTPPLNPSMPDEFRWAKLDNHPHIKEAVKLKKIITVADSINEKFTPLEQIIVDQLKLRSIWYIPVSITSGTIGVFIIASQGETRTCSEKELDLCRALSNIVAVALQNSLLHKELEEKHEELSTTLHSIGDAVIATDIGGNVVLMNPNAERLCGYSISEAKGKPLTEIFKIVNSKTGRKVKDPVSKVIANGKRVKLANHTVLISKKGNRFQISDSAAPILNEDGDITGVVLVFSDVTEDYALREALRESKNSLIKAELMGRFGNWELDLTTNKIVGSQGAAAIYGIDEQEFDLNAVQKIPLPEYRQSLDEALFNLIKNKKPYELEFKVKRADGQIRLVHSNATYNSKSGKVFGIIHDITERKLAEEALKESEAKYRKFFMKDLTGDFISTVEGKILDCNPSFISMLGYSSSEEIKNIKSKKFYTSSDERKKFITLLRKERELRNFELHLVRSDGKEITVIANALGIFDENDNLTHMQGYLFDITERKMYEKALVSAKEKAETADRMKTEFLAQMSHEIRSPLNAVLSFTGIVKDLTAEIKCEELDTCFSGISSASKRIIRTVDSILNMSDLQLGTYQLTERKIDIVELLRNLLAEFDNMVSDKSIGLKFNSNVKKKVIKIDEYAISQIVVNLIDNAIKYTRKGSVELKLEINDIVKISVKDTGIGISKEYLPRLFAPFTQEEQGYTRSYDGNGLGLALVQKYCDILDAKVSVKSKKNVGTTFSIVLNK